MTTGRWDALAQILWNPSWPGGWGYPGEEKPSFGVTFASECRLDNAKQRAARSGWDKRKGTTHTQTNTKTAILLGGSGMVGGFCLENLLAAPAYNRVILLTRRELALAPHPRLTQRQVNFDSLTAEDFAGVDDVFCALGTTIRKAGSQEAFRRVDRDYPLVAARLAHQAGSRQLILVSSVGADANSKNFYLRTKGELEQEIGKLGFEALHIFRPSLLLGKREEFRLGEKVMMTLAPALNLAMWGGLRRYRAIQAATVGRAMVKAAQDGERGTFIHEYDEIIRLAA